MILVSGLTRLSRFGRGLGSGAGSWHLTHCKAGPTALPCSYGAEIGLGFGAGSKRWRTGQPLGW